MNNNLRYGKIPVDYKTKQCSKQGKKICVVNCPELLHRSKKINTR
jgi:hypothetical protein